MDGGVFAILGASGCGKSMTLKCIAGIERPDEGRIVLNDRVMFDSKKNDKFAASKNGKSDICFRTMHYFLT